MQDYIKVLDNYFLILCKVTFLIVRTRDFFGNEDINSEAFPPAVFVFTLTIACQISPTVYFYSFTDGF